MSYDKELIIHKLERWDRFITNYHLPDWDFIPDLGLYMDQVVVLLVQYLSFIPSIPGGKESFVTSSAINNYVRLKIMPAPVKRKYYRVHIAYLIMILTMKQSISISDVQKIIPAVGIRGLLRKIPAAGPVLQPAGPKRRHRHPHPLRERGGGRGAAGHRVRTHRRVLQNSGGEADPPVRRRYGGRSGRRAAP